MPLKTPSYLASSAIQISYLSHYLGEKYNSVWGFRQNLTYIRKKYIPSERVRITLIVGVRPTGAIFGNYICRVSLRGLHLTGQFTANLQIIPSCRVGEQCGSLLMARFGRRSVRASRVVGSFRENSVGATIKILTCRSGHAISR